LNHTDIDYTEELLLLVDDEEAVREPFVEMLQHLGFQTDSAVSAQEALRLLNEKPYTFLITDISMPDISGLELIRRVKDDHPSVCSIAMTGFSKEYNYMDVVNAGAKDFINKPFGLDELVAKIRRAVIERNINRELNRLSITDSLTGLYNQRHFYARLEQEVMRAQRQKTNLALMLLDLDEFKAYNDTYGHLAGDALLEKVGSVINDNIRQGVDSGYRYGGDEFAIILIDADEEITKNISERLEKSIEKTCKLGISMGCVSFSRTMTVEEFVGDADTLLYNAKKRKKSLQNRDQ
jgi:diguanylate cyclase (GGDEF)-like protein